MIVQAIEEYQKCPCCGADLASVNGRLACLARPFGHYFGNFTDKSSDGGPQAREALFAIPTNPLRGNLLKPHKKWTIWEKRHSNLFEVQETLQDDGTRQIVAIMTGCPATPQTPASKPAKRRGNASKPHDYDCECRTCMAKIMATEMNPTDTAKYLEYVAMVQTAGIKARPWQSWVENYRNISSKPAG